jgi:hypothetical protein
MKFTVPISEVHHVRLIATIEADSPDDVQGKIAAGDFAEEKILDDNTMERYATDVFRVVEPPQKVYCQRCTAKINKSDAVAYAPDAFVCADCGPPTVAFVAALKEKVDTLKQVATELGTSLEEAAANPPLYSVRVERRLDARTWAPTTRPLNGVSLKTAYTFCLATIERTAPGSIRAFLAQNPPASGDDSTAALLVQWDSSADANPKLRVVPAEGDSFYAILIASSTYHVMDLKTKASDAWREAVLYLHRTLLQLAHGSAGDDHVLDATEALAECTLMLDTPDFPITGDMVRALVKKTENMPYTNVIVERITLHPNPTATNILCRKGNEIRVVHSMEEALKFLGDVGADIDTCSAYMAHLTKQGRHDEGVCYIYPTTPAVPFRQTP